MKKELLNEINNIRIKMGLKVLNEGSMLITEAGAVSALFSKVLPKSVIGATEKALILKFLQKGLTEIEKESLSKFFKSAEGKAFVTELRNEIANESDDALRMRLDAWLTTTERSLTKPKGAKKTKTNSGSLTTTMSQELSRDAKDLFGKMGKNLTSSQIEELNRAASQIVKGVSKLSDTQMVGLENSLKSIGINLEVVIQKLSKAKDMRSQERAKKLKQILDTIILYTNTASKSVGSIKLLFLSKATLVAMGVATLLAGANWVSKTYLGQKVIEYMPDVWTHIKALGPPTTTPEPESTPSPAPNETNKPDTREKLEW